MTGAGASFTGNLSAVQIQEAGVRLLQPAGLRIARGSTNVVLTSVNAAVTALSFGVTFASAPIVVATINAGSATMVCAVDTVTTTGCNLRAFRKDEATTTITVAVNWIAIGPA